MNAREIAVAIVDRFCGTERYADAHPLVQSQQHRLEQIIIDHLTPAFASHRAEVDELKRRQAYIPRERVEGM